jgi:exopolysaccharide biosynthesis WecB/TagA/CpsF family protein
MTLVTHITTAQQGVATAEGKIIFGVSICDLSRDAAIAVLLASIATDQHRKLAFCNAHTANSAWENENFRLLLKNFTVFADGLGIDMAAKALYGAPFMANLNGTDFVPALLQKAHIPLRLALIGSKPNIADLAAKQIANCTPQHSVCAVMHGFGSNDEVEDFLDTLAKNPVDILLVAMGNPKQEIWIAENISAKHARLAIGVGALFDFLTGEVPRAPLWVRALRIEWLYRLAQEPKRLFRRYVLGNPLFLLRVAWVKSGLRRF